ncbi:MAG: DUF1700 domain-containing protein [Lachnospiraceae bacterium]|nr:DUF1700 domain-containing protein [Lachnospiraceae bacterium]
MTQNEFVQELEQSLRGQVSPQVIEYNLHYYREYIREQLASGKSQEEVFELLGTPQMIAKTIISAEEAKGEAYSEPVEQEAKKSFTFSISDLKEKPWYQTVGIIAVILLAIYLLVSIIIAIVKILFWPAVIVAIAVAVWKYLEKNKK